MYTKQHLKNKLFLPCDWFLLDLEVFLDVVLVDERFQALRRHNHLPLKTIPIRSKFPTSRAVLKNFRTISFLLIHKFKKYPSNIWHPCTMVLASQSSSNFLLCSASSGDSATADVSSAGGVTYRLVSCSEFMTINVKIKR